MWCVLVEWWDAVRTSGMVGCGVLVEWRDVVRTSGMVGCGTY